jgi:hypothetical protein
MLPAWTIPWKEKEIEREIDLAGLAKGRIHVFFATSRIRKLPGLVIPGSNPKESGELMSRAEES